MDDVLKESPFDPGLNAEVEQENTKDKTPTSSTADGHSSIAGRTRDEMANDRRIVRTLRSFMKKSREYREDHLNIAENARRQYKNWEIETRSKIKRANIQPSYGFMIIETLLPQLCDVFFGDHNIVHFQGRTEEALQYDEKLTDFFDTQFADMQLELKSYSILKSMLMDGTAIAKVPYRFQEQLTQRRKMDKDPQTGMSFTSKEARMEVVYDGPDLEPIPLYDFFPDWRVKEPGAIYKMRGCVHRIFRSFSELERLEERTENGVKTGIYKNLPELKFSLKQKAGDAWGGPYWEDAAKRNFEQMDNRKHNLKDHDAIELWEYWGLYDLDGDGELEEAVVTVANGDTVIRAVPNFYDYKIKPFVAVVNYTRPNEFYGIPELAAVDAEMREAKAIRNARLDQINLAVNTMWLVDRTGGIDTRNLYSRPGGIIYTNDMNALKPVTVGDPSLSSGQEMQNIEAQISQTTAIGSPPVVGSSKSFARSATGVNFVQQFAASRIGLKAKVVAKLYFEKLVHIMMMTNRQFVTEAQWIRSNDPNTPNPFSQLPPDSFFHNYDFIVRTKPDEADDSRFQKMQSISQILQVAEQTQPGSVKMDVVLEAVLRPLLGSEVKRFVRSEAEMQQLKQQNMLMRIQEQQANAQIGQQAPQPNANPQSTGGPLNGTP